MTVETQSKTCPRCNSIIAEDAPGGLCPRCLMQFVAMSTGSADFTAEDRLPPDLETVRAAFPHLEIIELVGQGGMGAVFKARQTKLDRVVALKILPQRLAREPLFAERFEREGRLLARLSHPNIVGVHDFGQASGLYYLMMEYVDGVNLRQAFATAQFTPQQALSIIPKICEALQFAHDEGVLHRDIKPENILLDTKGRVKIADFGIAKFSGLDEKTGLTATGATIGTPHYMAPEQIERPADVDHRADIFSLGVVFYEMLTGELPLGRFAAPSERTESLDVRIDQVVMRALEKDRERRQQSANEVRTEVEFLKSHAVNEAALRSDPQAASAGSEPKESNSGSESSTQNDAPITATAAQPPVVAHSKNQRRFGGRPTIAMALIVASLVLPIGVTLYLGTAPIYPRLDTNSGVYLAMIAAWFGIPGTILGIMHLQYLGKSGHRHGLLTAVVASTFWPFTLALGFFYLLALQVLQLFHRGSLNSVEPLEATVVLVLGLVATTLAVRSLVRWVNRTAPQPGFTDTKPQTNTASRLLVQVVAGGLWIVFGLSIILLSPVGTLERILLALILIGLAVMGARSVKRWIEGTAPAEALASASTHPVDKAIRNLWKSLAFLVWLGLVVVTFSQMPRSRPEMEMSSPGNVPMQASVSLAPQLLMDIASLSTNENVLTIDIVDINSSLATDSMSQEDVGEAQAETTADIPNRYETSLRVDFQGPGLLPEAVISASESFPNQCYFPGEPTEPVTLDMSAGKTFTMAFAFPDPKTAQSCKLRIERQQQAGQWPISMNVNGDRRLLFQVYSALGEYSVSVEPRR